MSMVRMFHVECDTCGASEGDEWYASHAIQVAKEDGFHLRGDQAICADCWESGVRFKDIKGE